jgi:hypothetical protein
MKSNGILLSLISFLILSCYPIEDSLTGPEAGNSRVLIENIEYTGTARYTHKNHAGKMYEAVLLELENGGIIQILCTEFQQGTISSNHLKYVGPLSARFSLSSCIFDAMRGTLQVDDLTSDSMKGTFHFIMYSWLSSHSDCEGSVTQISGDFYALME